MSKVQVNGFSISVAGYGASKDQNLASPPGVGGEALHTWIVGTGRFRECSPPAASAVSEIRGPANVRSRMRPQRRCRRMPSPQCGCRVARGQEEENPFHRHGNPDRCTPTRAP
jgi:hypothetical protein